jgi:hypothetical protein
MTAAAMPRAFDGTARTMPPADHVVDALETERRLLDELTAIVERQRAAFGAGDQDAIEQSSHALHRVLHTLNEARSRRRRIGPLSGAGNVPIGAIQQLLGDRMTDTVRGALARLEQAACRLSGEIEMNRQVLQLIREGERSPDPFPADRTRSGRGCTPHR